MSDGNAPDRDCRTIQGLERVGLGDRFFFRAEEGIGDLTVTGVQTCALPIYYKAHPEQFQQAEQATVEYVVLDIASLRDSITLNEDDLRTYYKENVDRID